MVIMGRATSELRNGDWTLAILLAAIAVECDLAYLFMKWKRIDLMPTRMPNKADEDSWQKEWQDKARSLQAKLDTVSKLLTGQSFDSFASQNAGFLGAVRAHHPDLKNETSAKKLFVEALFRKRNRIAHFGEIDFQRGDAELCVTLATTLFQMLRAMDVHRLGELDAKHVAQ
jgi:hypothetical protein